MSRFTRICTTRERLRATLHIENFSMYLCKGIFNSPVLETESKRSRWSFSVFAEDGDDYANFITVFLKKEDCEADEVSVEVTASAIDCFGLPALAKKKKIVFNRPGDIQIFSIAKNKILKNCSLNRRILIPNDVLTLQCEMVIYKEEIFSFPTEEEFYDNLRNVHSLGINDGPEYFVNSHFTTQVFDFTQRIDDFSVVACQGRYVCPEYQSEPSNEKWNLVLYVDNTEFGDNFVSIGLKRSDINKGELVEAKLSVVDDSGIPPAVKLLYFTDSIDKRVLSVPKQDKKRLIPNDTLHLKCEVSLHKENVSAFATKDEFDSSIKSHARYDGGYLPLLMNYAFLILLTVVYVTENASDKVMYVAPMIWKYTAGAVMSLCRRVGGGAVIGYQLGQFIAYCLGFIQRTPSTNVFVQFSGQIMKSNFMYWLVQIASWVSWFFKITFRIIRYLFSNGQRNNIQNRAHANNRNAIVPYRRQEVASYRERNYNTRNYNSDVEYYPYQRNQNRNYRY